MIEVGEYIRTKLGHIGIVKRIEFDNIDKSLKWYVFDYKEPEINRVKEEYINKPYITKHSKNIIDLIEVGDYVNGWKVLSVVPTFDKPDEIGIKLQGFDNLLYDIKIYSIVTKELFNSVMYKVVK